MKKVKNIIEYDYIIRNISDSKSPVYKAIIPFFNGVVLGKSLGEIEKGVAFSIDEEIKARKKKGLKIPLPDKDIKYSGKLVLRIDPLLHERLVLEAKAKNKSLNKYIQEKIA